MKTVLKQILMNRAVIWILIGCLIFLGALQLFVIKGCHSSITKTAPVLQQAEQENNTSSVKKVAEHNPSEKTPPNDPWTTIYSALIPKGASPPDEYHGDILYWIPGMEYETIVNVDGTRESKIVLPDHKEKNDRVHKALGKLKVEYEAQGKSASDEEARQISIEIWTDGFSALNAAKFLGAGGGALDGKYAIEFTQKALDENPNDFHTLYLWSIRHDFNGGPITANWKINQSPGIAGSLK